MAWQGIVRNAVLLGAITGLVGQVMAEEIPEFLLVQGETTPAQGGPTSDSSSGMAAPSQSPAGSQFSSQSGSQFSSSSGGSRSFSSGLRRPSSSLYDSPNMFGDLFSPGGTLSFQSNTTVLLADPFAQATLDPLQLNQIQQQLSQQATLDVQNQIIVLQQQDPSGLPINPTDVTVNIVLPDLSGAIIQPSPQFAVIQVEGMVDLQLGGGTRRTKIMENNHTLPQDRVAFAFNHFHNAIVTDEFVLPSDVNGVTSSLDVVSRRRILSVNRYTLGFEKTFEDGQSSLEIRMPLIGDLPNSDGLSIGSQGGNLGNLSLILKRLFYTTDNFAVAAGVGFNVPTGSDATGFVGDLDWEVTNEAVHYLPYLGVAGSPSDNFFYQAFAQLDIPSIGNSVEINDGSGRNRVGRLNEQTLLYLDATGGAWLYRDPNSRLAGLASIFELHYTTTLQDADQFGVFAANPNSFPGSSNFLLFGNNDNRQDILNGSVGLHTVLQSGTSIRVGGVFPLSKQDDKRLFDAEVQASVNIPF